MALSFISLRIKIEAGTRRSPEKKLICLLCPSESYSDSRTRVNSLCRWLACSSSLETMPGTGRKEEKINKLNMCVCARARACVCVWESERAREREGERQWLSPSWGLDPGYLDISSKERRNGPEEPQLSRNLLLGPGEDLPVLLVPSLEISLSNPPCFKSFRNPSVPSGAWRGPGPSINPEANLQYPCSFLANVKTPPLPPTQSLCITLYSLQRTCIFVFLFFWLPCMACGTLVSLTSDQPGPLQWTRRTLVTGSPTKSPYLFFIY